MITQTQKQVAVTTSAKIIQSISDFKALVAKNGLPISDNMQTLETALRSQLFQKLLAVDKGLKLRWDMLKTDDSRIKLITDTINLDGYNEVKELHEALETIKTQYKQIWTGENWLHCAIPFALFVDKWEMNLDKVLSSLVFDWTGKEDVLEYVQNLAPTLTKLREVFRALTNDTYSLQETLTFLSVLYTPESSRETIEAKESAVMGLAKELEAANARHVINA